MGLRRGTVLIAGLLVLGGCVEKGDFARFGTFNVQFLPGSSDGDCSVLPPNVPCDPTGHTRATRIAERILAGNYDVIVLNEVFDEEARDDFVRKLRRKYPAYVAYLGDDAVGTEDSGLMLFSRFPFQHLPQTSHRAEADDVEARNFGANWKDVAFIEYDYDVFPDNWAAKGCGFARIKNSDSKRVYNVAFTHMQASYPEDEDDQSEWLEPIQARSGQLQQIETMLKGTLLAHQFGREDVFLLGDMNIDGDLADPNLGTAGYDRPNLWEWTVAFNNTTLGGFFTDVLHDTWAFEQSRQDRGLTNHYHWGPEYSPNQGARLDYFLRNRKSNENLCVQHLTLAHNLRWGAPYMETGFGPAGNIELSDHIGVNAELNVRTPNCDPSDALIDPPLDGWYTIPMEIPGQAKWLRFDTPGTYSFAAEGAGADFEVYAAKDLTVPVPQYFDETLTFTTRRGETVVGKKFINPDPPLYVKLMMSPRSRTGSMKFIAHRANCRDREEACVLRPHEEFTHTMPGIPVEPDDRFWFEIRTEAADSGRAQHLSFQVDDFSPSGAFDLRLVDEAGTTVIDSDESAEPDPSNPGKYLLKIARDDLPAAASKMYMIAERDNPAATSLDANWSTNLTILHGQRVGVPGATSTNLYCVEETDSIGIDEISLTIKADGVTLVDDVYIGDFDDGVYRTLEDFVHAIRFVDEVKVVLRDEDGGANGGDDFLRATIGGLPAGKTELLGQSAVLACCDGRYLFRYNLSGSLQKAN